MMLSLITLRFINAGIIQNDSTLGVILAWMG